MTIDVTSSSTPQDQHAPCALCGNMALLRNSHIIPVFAFRWLKSRSVTKHLRRATNPNVRVQDGDKPKLLCEECEQRLSARETIFNSKFFRPALSSNEAIRYDDWLLYFCVSLSWRVLTHMFGKHDVSAYSDAQRSLAQAASECWKSFLLGTAPHPAQFCQHILVFRELRGHPPPELPSNINRYLLGGIEMDVVGDSHSLMTFAKIGPVAIFGMICPPEGKWEGTRVCVRSGTLVPGKFQAPHKLSAFFLDRAALVAATYDGMSEHQHRKVSDQYNSAILSDPERYIRSAHGRAVLADARMFGESAVIDKRSV